MQHSAYSDFVTTLVPSWIPGQRFWTYRHYLEDRISSGDRIVFRVEGSSIYFMDVVKHDDIGRYGRRPRQAR